MNQSQIQQLTLQLSQALDQNYDVVNMEAVLSVICALEGTTITKEQLEATRLAKYINQLRRRTTNEHLARRAKSLLKKWREMVGIQQSSHDTQSQHLQSQQSPQSFKSTIVINENSTDQGTSEAVGNTIQYSQLHSPVKFDTNAGTSTTMSNAWNNAKCANLSTQNRSISDFHINTASEIPCTTGGVQQQQQQYPSNFYLINNSNSNSKSAENSSMDRLLKSKRGHRKQQEAPSCVNEQSSNSATHHTVGSNKILEPPIVIDIVSDSDDCDGGSQRKTESTTFPATPAAYLKSRKLKKEKKRKDKDSRTKSSLISPSELISQSSQHNSQARDSNIAPVKSSKIVTQCPPMSEILSLSNSSMSSMLSENTVAGNSQTKLPANSSNLSFAGRFNFNSQENSNADNSVTENKLKRVTSPHESLNMDQSRSTAYGDFLINDTSTSCSRLSTFEDHDNQRIRNQNLNEAGVISVDHQVSSNMPASKGYTEAGPTQIPKKRGRKKGSKGVDSLIAKEASLSQQIFFGSGVKKVKTTKELFNEIQNRKLNVASNRNESAPASAKGAPTTPTHRTLQSSALPQRPISSCSETSMHSPHTLDAYSTNATSIDKTNFSSKFEDNGNTDSDTVTSDPSHDSVKSREIKRSTSVDSNSNSMPTSSAKTTGTSTPAICDDVSIQLTHLMQSLGAPISISELEKSYQAQIVPCSCIILEEMPDGFDDKDNQKDDTIKNENGENGSAISKGDTNDCTKVKTELTTDEVPPPVQPKPVKSIFDLDFDEDDDPLNSLINDLSSSASALKPSADGDSKMASLKSVSNDNNNPDLHHVGENDPEHENNDVVQEIFPTFTVQEDPNCIAKQRFDIQTNEVTKFHVDMLHKCYIPNINGNWDCSPLTNQASLPEVLKELDSYEITDGTDVVPRYGSLIYERIKKDLDLLKFSTNVEIKHKKHLKHHDTPFLGVAKCLPSCRKKKPPKNLVKLKSEPIVNNVPEEDTTTTVTAAENITNSLNIGESTSPLRVDILPDDKDKEYLNSPYGDWESKNNASFSCDLLKLADNDIENDILQLVKDNGDNSNEHDLAEDETDKKQSPCRRSSTCSNSSLKLNQLSINKKLRNQRNLIAQGRRRKKRRKSAGDAGTTSEVEEECRVSEPARPRIKRIKIAINGNIATQRQISHMSSSNNSSDDDSEISKALSETSDREDGEEPKSKNKTASDDEHESNRSYSTTMESIAADEEGLGLENENEHEYDNSNDEEYAIVQKPMGGSNNHIVFTIKKTPSKINSPANSLSAVSPIVINNTDITSDSVNVKPSSPNECVADSIPLTQHSNEELISENNNKDVNDELSSYFVTHAFLTRCDRRKRRRRRRKVNCVKDIFNAEHLFKHFSENADTKPQTNVKQQKSHKKLFFPDELWRRDRRGNMERIINYSSSSSNADESEFEYVYDSSSDEAEKTCKDNNMLKIETDRRSPTAISATVANDDESRGDGDLYLWSDDETSSSEDSEGVPDDDANDNKSKETDIEVEDLENQQSELPPQNNGMLASFNSILAERSPTPTQSASEPNKPLPQNENYDVNLYNNNNSLGVIKDSIDAKENNDKNVTSDIPDRLLNNVKSDQSQNDNDPQELLLPRLEYQTGMRAVTDGLVQQFKEWHQVLQLQSYNDKPLIVLPYVVLE